MSEKRKLLIVMIEPESGPSALVAYPDLFKNVIANDPERRTQGIGLKERFAQPVLEKIFEADGVMVWGPL